MELLTDRVPWVEAVAVQLYDENMDCRLTPSSHLCELNMRAYSKNATYFLNWNCQLLSCCAMRN